MYRDDEGKADRLHEKVLKLHNEYDELFEAQLQDLVELNRVCEPEDMLSYTEMQKIVIDELGTRVDWVDNELEKDRNDPF